MTDKILFRTIKIRVPEEFVVHDKNGNITIKHTLTKAKSISKVKGEPNIDLIPDENIDHAEIINKGEKIDHLAEKKKTRKYIKKAVGVFRDEIIPDIKPARNLRN